MQWKSLADFLNMGGYGLYVWGSYGLAALLMAVEVVLLRQRRRSILEKLARTSEREPT